VIEIRPRRLRRGPLVRDLVAESGLSLASLIQPYFVTEGESASEPIPGFSGVNRWGMDALSRRIETDVERGVKSFLLFGRAGSKDSEGTPAYAPESLVARTLRTLKSRFGANATLFTDVCLCPYTSHGHCGVLRGAEIDNDASLEPLSRMALAHADAGADFVAPSDMMDGRVAAIRRTLDLAGHSGVGILAYTAKYASAYYGPFREALGSAPKGDRSTYQMDFRNRGEALRELDLDVAEGADIVMVKPALAYLDIISLFAARAPVPVAAYSVSGEYQMVKELARAGLADERSLLIENLTAIRRAGARVIITYAASEMAEKEWVR